MLHLPVTLGIGCFHPLLRRQASGVRKDIGWFHPLLGFEAGCGVESPSARLFGKVWGGVTPCLTVKKGVGWSHCLLSSQTERRMVSTLLLGNSLGGFILCLTVSQSVG
jgi:hypothetical protein